MIDKKREIALKVLYEIEKTKAYSNIALDKALKQARKERQQEKIDKRDAGFISEIVYGTISWKLTIDEIIKKYSHIKWNKISPWILNILRMSIYQILFLDKVPKSAAVNEGVQLAKRYGHKASGNFVNAILRNVEKKDYEAFFQIENKVEKIAKTNSMPIWLVEELLKQNTQKQVEEICKASNVKPKLFIRINHLKSDKKTLIQNLEKEGIIIKEQKGNSDFLIIQGAKNLENIKAYQEGKFSIQDEAAGLIPKILNPKPNEKVLDACSSPGGKTAYMAERMNNQGEIQAWDLHEHRVKLVENATKRLGITIVETKVKDATLYEEKYFEYFDKILLDVPCLGIGVLKRKPDIKWKRQKQDIFQIAKTQEKILNNCCNYLKKGGQLVYATCSILKEENEERIEQFLKTHENFKIEKINLTQEEKAIFSQDILKKEGFLKIFQNEITDGFFICKMKKQ